MTDGINAEVVIELYGIEVYDVIDECERLSYTICEICGDSGKPREGGWIKTLCDEHAKGGITAMIGEGR